MVKSQANTDWRPSASLAVLQIRAKLLADIRQFFTEKGVLEVETPILSHAATTDPNLESFETTFIGPGSPLAQDIYLHTSPEFAMKRLLAAGSGAIYQICKVFRQGELGRLHNPEFTLLEWYRPGFDQYALMSELEDLLTPLLFPYYDLGAPQYISYQQAFINKLSVDPISTSVEELKDCAGQNGLDIDQFSEQDTNFWLDYLLTHIIQPELGRQHLTFLVDFPVSQASLARINPQNSHIAERFELFFAGVELANGYHELANSDEQQQRMRQELGQRTVQQKRVVPIDDRFVAALRYGLPDCSGVAVGIDRLIYLMLKKNKLGDTLSFSFPIA